jgi:hypothetical protein
MLFALGRGFIGQVFRKINVTEQTYYRWRRNYESLSVDQAKGFKKVKKGNAHFFQLFVWFFGLPYVGVVKW